MEGEEMGMVSIDNSFKKFDWRREREWGQELEEEVK